MVQTHIVGSISWNSHGWTDEPTEADKRRSGFESIRSGYFGNESWNFSLTDNVADGYKYGSFENAHRARRPVGLVFFFSIGPQGGVFVGLYARAELLSKRVRLKQDGPLFNLRVPIEPGFLICPFKHHLLAEPERHFREGSLMKKGPGQICFCYIDHASAARIVNDALKAGNGNVAPIKKMYGF
jgi:hypothetical protein